MVRVLRRKLWLALVPTFVVVAVSAWFFVFRPTQPRNGQASNPTSTMSHQPGVEQELMNAAATVNANVPQKVDEITTLERATASKRTLTYYYRVKAKASQREELRQGVLRTVIPQICTGSTREFMKRTGVAYEYRWDSEGFSEPLSIIVDEQTCAIMWR